ncbi:complement factor H isoform X2 [Cynoglossus semilaevis]|uniref:complement factor H isoform X2 n=1 Tax=Cynoglossus semilaevis TaxID=244447 RepID=UPI0004974B35|nr:complement decay-accelerating factor isoform X2 [Cynoglossus semilaevis]
MDVLLDTCGTYLLLFHLFVLKAAAQCSKHPGGENIVFTRETLLLNDFPEGSEVTFQCASGYTIDSGSGVSKCISGHWSALDLRCKKKDCGLPQPQPHMRFNTSEGTLFGNHLKVTCDEGYQIRGSSFKQCLFSGWFGTSRCEVVTCQKPAVVAHGRSLWDSQDGPRYGENIHYVCNEGYTLVGNSSIRCGKGGDYDSGPPECKVSFVAGTTGDGNTTNTTSAQGGTTAAPSPPSHPCASSTVQPSISLSSLRTSTSRLWDVPTISATSQGYETTTTSGTVPPGGIVTTDDRTTSKSATSAPTTTTLSLRGRQDGAVDSSVDMGHVPVVISVISVTLVAIILMFFLHKFLKRRKGSYDTREDLKPELLQFQNL